MLFDFVSSVMEKIAHLTLAYPKVFHAIVIVLSFALMVKSADLIVNSISNYAKKLGISDYLIGILVVAIGSSTPELVSSVTGAFLGEGGIVFGTIIGSNISGLTLVVGLVALIGKKLALKKSILEKTRADVFLLSLLPFIVMIDSHLSRIDGVILVVSYFIYIGMIWGREGQAGKIRKKVMFKEIYRDGVIFLGSLIVLLLSGRWLVFSSIHLSKNIGVSPYYIALIVIGIGATMPDLSVGIRSVLSGHQGVGFGNVIGSLLMKYLLLLGTIALIKPFYFNFLMLLPAAIFSAVALLYVLKHSGKEYITWKQGLILISIYLVFIMYEWFVG
ncbi:MAG: hypothetical protein N3D84_03370 [Candidatus Woesearchaeota archaeon]|nr:hypothetical protein [Candidatus Woesearchaeota archaeon]